MRRSSEPIWWVPFGAGMMLDAMLAPALILVTGFLLPFGLLPDSFRELMLHPITRLVLFVFCSATFFHAAHRLRFTLQDLGLHKLKGVLPFLCYGGAILGTLAAGAIALNLV